MEQRFSTLNEGILGLDTLLEPLTRSFGKNPLERKGRIAVIHKRINSIDAILCLDNSWIPYRNIIGGSFCY